MTIWLRAETSKGKGLGHLMRAVALAEAASSLGALTRLVSEETKLAEKVFRVPGGEVLYPGHAEDWLGAIQPQDFVIFDGYEIGQSVKDEATRTAAGTAAFQDVIHGPQQAGLIVNPNITLPPQKGRLTGPAFAPVRERFRELRRERADPLSTVVITSGGSDSGRITEKVLPLLLAVGLEVLVVLGPDANDASIEGVEVIRDPQDIAGVFDRGQLAISAAGSTTWELACMGVPAILAQVADNQRHIGPTAEAMGAAMFVGSTDQIEKELPLALERIQDETVRAGLSTAGMQLVDGLGATRILEVLMKLSLRP